MVKTTIMALLLSFLTVASPYLIKPAIANDDIAALKAENEKLFNQLSSVKKDRDHLRGRLGRAIAYSKERGSKLDQAEKQLATANSGLSRAIAYSTARGSKSRETEKQLASATEGRRELAARLRRAIAFSKERGEQLEAATEQRDALRTRLGRANDASTSMVVQLRESESELTSATEKQRELAARLRRAIAFSKARGSKLAETEKKLATANEGLTRAIAYSSARGSKSRETEKQLASATEKQRELAARLRRAIAFSKERGKQLDATTAHRDKLRASLRRANDRSSSKGIQLLEAQKKLASATEGRKALAVRLANAVVGSKAAEKKLEAAEQQLAAAAGEQSSTISTAWATSVGESLQASIGGLQGTEIITNSDNSVKVQVGNNGLFRTGGSALSDSGRALLSEIAPQLSIQNAALTVVGHTDSIPVGEDSRFGSNEALSFARAVSTLQFLRNEGLPSQRLSAAGFGEFNPIASNDTVEGRAQNRRVDIILREQ